MITADDYRQRIRSGVGPLPPRSLELPEALGCVLAEAPVAGFDLPPFNSSAMDGFAVRAGDIASAGEKTPVRLTVVGEAMMGSPSPIPVGPGEAVVIPTGAVMPPGADTVVPVERCERRGPEVAVYAALQQGKHVRRAGEDCRAGQVLMEPGRPLSAADLGALSSSGAALVSVIPRVRVGILSTGDELVRPAGALTAGKIFDSNAFMLAAQVREAGGSPVDLGPVADDSGALVAVLNQAAAEVDCFVCSGGVSAGSNDPVKRAFAPGDDICCLQVAVQPGRPQAFGSINGRAFFGLPGNPVAAFVSFEVFVRPALQRMMGLPEEREPVAAIFDGTMEISALLRFVPARLGGQSGSRIATPVRERNSNLLVRFARAGCLVEVPAGEALGPGDPCRVRPLR